MYDCMYPLLSVMLASGRLPVLLKMGAIMQVEDHKLTGRVYCFVANHNTGKRVDVSLHPSCVACGQTIPPRSLIIYHAVWYLSNMIIRGVDDYTCMMHSDSVGKQLALGRHLTTVHMCIQSF